MTKQCFSMILSGSCACKMISDVAHTGAERFVKEMMTVILIWEMETWSSGKCDERINGDIHSHSQENIGFGSRFLTGN